MIYLTYDGEIKRREGVIVDQHENKRTIDPLTIRQFLSFLSQFENGVRVKFNPTKDFEIEVLPCPTDA